MKFIKLTLSDGSKVYVNLCLVFDIFKNEFSKSRTTALSFGNDYVLNVLETPEEIIKQINK